MTATDQATREPVDVDSLPPTQCLVLEVLAARHRTGETHWTFPSRLRPHMEALARARLVSWEYGAQGQIWTRFTDAGRAAALSAGWGPVSGSPRSSTGGVSGSMASPPTRRKPGSGSGRSTSAMVIRWRRPSAPTS